MAKDNERWTGAKGYFGTLFQARLWQGHSKEEYECVETLRELEIEYDGNRRLILRELLKSWKAHSGDFTTGENISQVVNQAVDRAIDEIVEALSNGQLPAIQPQTSTPDIITDMKARAKAMFKTNSERGAE